jgi:type IV secretory pathway VirD2 relaxase
MNYERRDEDDAFRPRFGRRRLPDRDRAPTLRGGVPRRTATLQIGRVAVRGPGETARRCVIKARFVPVRTHGAKANRMHLDYLERDGVGRDGSPGRLYGADDKFQGEDFRRPLEGEQRQFRFIVSPEDGDALDLTAFARRFMSQVEKDLGRDLIWAAVNHHNTDNPHIHIVVRRVG